MSGHDSPNSSPSLQSRPPELADRQREVCDALAREGDQVVALYVGALRVLADFENPARIRLAACGLREVLDDFQDAPKGDSLKVKVRRLAESWTVTRRSQRSERSGEFDETLTHFFAEFEDDFPQRRELAGKTIMKLDRSGRTPSPVVHQARGQAWMDLSSYFSNVLHGKIRPADEEFAARREALEGFLLDLFQPPTFNNYDQLDELISEGPPDG
jgi:hypothetical protein